MWNCSTLCVNIFPEFAGAVAARPVSYAAVLRMKADSSSALNSHARPRQRHRSALGAREWPVFSSHPLSSVSLLSSQEDFMSEGKNPGDIHVCRCKYKLNNPSFPCNKVFTHWETVCLKRHSTSNLSSLMCIPEYQMQAAALFCLKSFLFNQSCNSVCKHDQPLKLTWHCSRLQK